MDKGTSSGQYIDDWRLMKKLLGTREGKYLAVRTVLSKHPDWSNTKIAEMTRLTAPEVAQIRAERPEYSPPSVDPAIARSSFGNRRLWMLDNLTGPLVYFVESGEGGPVKIGKTVGLLSDRIHELQVGNPDPLLPLGAIRGGIPTEAALHRQIDHARLRSEWFHRAPALALFERVCEAEPHLVLFRASTL